MAISDDWTIDYTAKTITHSAGITVYTVRELYSYLMDVFDELGQMDDTVPMSAQTPTEFSLINGWSIPAASYQFLKGGAVNDGTNNDLWANIYTLGTIEASAQIYLVQNGTKLTSYWPAGHVDLLVRVKQNNTLIAAGIVTIFARELSDAYDHFAIDLSNGGRNAVPLATSDDLNNQTATGTISGWSDIVVAFGNVNKDLNNGAGARTYAVSVDCGGRALAQVYERLKWLCRSGSVVELGTVTGEQYISANPAFTAVKSAPFGTFAGGKFFGAQGIWIENYDAADAKSFQLIDSSGATQTPPNVVAIRVTSVAIGDRVGVFVLTGAGGTINKARYNAAAGNNSGNGTLVVAETIAADTPSSGVVRINGDRYAYTSWTTSTFTLAGTLSANYTAGADVYVPLIDEEAASTVASNMLKYSADIPVLIRVRRKGILPFEVETSVTNAGLSVAAIRTVDSIVQ